MAKQILVPISRNDRVKEMIPYVERVALPGMKVVFLVPYPVDGFVEHIRAGRFTGETGIPNPEKVRKIAARYSWESQQQLARQRVFPACHALQKKGAEVTVDVYTGSLRKAVKRYALTGDVHLMMAHAGIGRVISRSLKNLFSILRSSRRPSFSPTLSLVANGWPE